MGLRDINVEPTAALAVSTLNGTPTAIALNQTNKRCFAWVAPFAGIITAVEVYATTVTANLSFDVRVNTTSVLSAPPAVPVADTVVQPTLAASAATRRFKKGDTIAVVYTTDGAGAATNPSVLISVRPFPMRGEVAVGP